MSGSNKKPKVSVTVVTYNHGEWLRECLESIVTQKTDFSFEVIVGDDASTDNTTHNILLDYASRYPTLIYPVFREKNVGGTQNYLDLMLRARGEYIAHIDGDDLMLPEKLQKQSNFLDNHPECSMVIHPVIRVDADGREKFRDKTGSDDYQIFDLDRIVETANCVVHSSKMYRASAIITRSSNRRLRDFYFNIEHASKGTVGSLNEYLGKYRLSVGVSNSEGLKTRWELNSWIFAYARELGATNKAVNRGKMIERAALVVDGIKINDPYIKELIRFPVRDWLQAPWKLKIISALSLVLGDEAAIKIIAAIYRGRHKAFHL